MKNKFSVDNWDKYYKEGRDMHIKPRAGFFESYDIFLCDSILEEYLPINNGDKKNVKICEIGSGDGKLLKKISDKFNYEPAGIEFSKEAAEKSKALGIKTIEQNVFDENLLKEYSECFDVIYSYGFAEHILPPEKATKVHLQLLKKGGLFFIQIPRLKGFNYLKIKLFRPDLLPLHNLNLMEEEALRTACKIDHVQELFCKKYGTLKLRAPLVKKDLKWYFFKVLCLLDYILNPLFRILFGKKGFETKLFSPNVIFIGKKI